MTIKAENKSQMSYYASKILKKNMYSVSKSSAEVLQTTLLLQAQLLVDD